MAKAPVLKTGGRKPLQVRILCPPLDLRSWSSQSRDAPCPVSFDRGSSFELQAQFGEQRDGGIERFHYDTDVLHPLDRHRRSAFPTGSNSRRTCSDP